MGSNLSYSDRPDQIDAVEIFNADGQGNAILVCEHASNYIPSEMNNLGLEADLLESHIAWDPGALQVARLLAVQLESPLVAAKVSRLVYDCNRPPEAKDASPSKSEIFEIPGNMDMTAEDRKWREDHVYSPFKNALAEVVKSRIDAGKAPLFFTIHSFTPVYNGNKREVEIGIIHDADSRIADEMLAKDSDFITRRNEPYAASDGVTHTLRLHAIPNNLANVMIEIRNDLLADQAGVQRVAKHLGEVFSDIMKKF